MVMFFGKPAPDPTPEPEMDVMMVYATVAVGVAILLAMMLMQTKTKLAAAEKDAKMLADKVAMTPPAKPGTRLKDKVCIVTGSSKGIGKGIAIRLGQEGAKVVVNYRSDPEGAKATAMEVEKASGHKTAAIHANLGKVEDCKKLVEESAKYYGTLDVLVNNAGYEVNADFWNVMEKDWDGVIDVNLKGPFFTTQIFVQKLMEWKKKGTVVNMSSVHEDVPFPGFAPYCCSKGGMKMMTRNLMVELAPLGITINNVAPGAIATPINQSILDDPEKKAELMSKIPLKRLGVPEDIAACVVYLASEEAAYVTGTTIFVDGGLTWFYEEKH
jgi:glucose 1-dehydrogenase